MSQGLGASFWTAERQGKDAVNSEDDRARDGQGEESVYQGSDRSEIPSTEKEGEERGGEEREREDRRRERRGPRTAFEAVRATVLETGNCKGQRAL